MRRTLAVAAVLIAAGMAGCTGQGTPAATPAAQNSELKYSQCMRDQGMTWFPDPGADGGLSVSIPEGTDQDKFTKAEEACKAYAPGANQNGRPLGAADLDKVRQMAQCVRDHGFPKYPDPDANGGIQIDEESTGIAHDDPAFQQAMRECQKYLPPRKKS